MLQTLVGDDGDDYLDSAPMWHMELVHNKDPWEREVVLWIFGFGRGLHSLVESIERQQQEGRLSSRFSYHYLREGGRIQDGQWATLNDFEKVLEKMVKNGY